MISTGLSRPDGTTLDRLVFYGGLLKILKQREKKEEKVTSEGHMSPLSPPPCHPVTGLHLSLDRLLRHRMFDVVS